MILLRSTKAGAETLATQLFDEIDGDLQGRSTKAGAETPATPKGQPPFKLPVIAAQRRPGPRPRRHSSQT